MNARLFACVVLAAICFAQADFTPMSWAGKWTFNDGTMNMCTTSDNSTLQVIRNYSVNNYLSGFTVQYEREIEQNRIN